MPDIVTILLEGDHASRPAAGDVAEGTLYSCSDHDIIYQSDGAAWNNWAVIAGAAPGVHAASHQNGGSDEVNVAGLSGLLADGQTPIAHKTSHENGGADEISVAGLSGVLADPQTPATHSHVQADVTDLETDIAAIEADIDALQTVVAPAGQGTWLASGGGVSLVSALTFLVSAGSGYINGTFLSWAQDTVALDAADATFDRFDAIIVNDTGAVDKITGTASASPELPSIDVLTQLVLSYVLVQAGVTTIPVTKTAIYQEDTEWTSAQSGGTINAASVSDPFAGTVVIEATAAANGHFVEFSDVPISLSGQKQLVFQIKNKATWPGQKSIAITWFNGATKIGQSVQLSNGKYGFNHANVTTYQQIVIPITDFQVSGSATVDKLRFAISGGGAAIGWRIDDIFLDASSTVIIVQPVAVASASVSGTVKTDVTVGSPVVYVKESVDTALALKAPLASPALTGTPTAPTQSSGDDSTALATTEYVDDAVAAVITDVDDNGLPYVIDGGGVVITTGEKAGFIRIPFTGHIVGWSLYGDGTSGSIVIDSWKDTHANFPPTVADTIWGGTRPEISADTDAEGTGLSIAVTKGEIIRHNVVSVTGFTEATLNYHLTRL